MDELRLERALRAGPPFARAYVVRPLALDRELAMPPPVSARRMLTIVAAAALLLAALVAALVIGSRLLPQQSRWDVSVQVPRGAFNYDWYRALEDGALVPLGDELPALTTDPTWSQDGRTLAYLRRSQLWLVTGDGSNRRELPEPSVPPLDDVISHGEAVFSPDSSMLAVQWQSCRTVGDECVIVEGIGIYFADGRFRSSIDITGMLAGGIVWSPESDRVGYTACLVEPDPCPFGTEADGDPIHQFVINDVDSATPIAQVQVQGRVAGWTADDRLLVSNTTGAYTIDTAGGNATWVLGPIEGQPDGSMDPPVWSNDGSMLAWAPRDDPVLWVRDTRTGSDREVISFADQVGLWALITVAPVGWSPDDRYLVFYEFHREETDAEPLDERIFYVVTADGQDLRRFDSAESVSWRPAGD